MSGVKRPATDKPYGETNKMGNVKKRATDRRYYGLLSNYYIIK